MSLTIGIDFDNTIINYDQAFFDLALAKDWIKESAGKKSKREVKELHAYKCGQYTPNTVHMAGLCYHKWVTSPCIPYLRKDQTEKKIGLGRERRWCVLQKGCPCDESRRRWL